MSNLSSLVIYILVYVVSAYLLSKTYKNNKLIVTVGLLIPILFAGCRFKVGTDFWQYMTNFIRWDSLTYSELLKESGGIVLYKSVCKFAYGLGGRVLTWCVLATLVLIPVYRTLRREYQKIFLGTAIAVFLLTAFTSAFNLSKQYIAVSIVFFGMKYIFDDKFLKFMLCVIIATLFHETAAIALVLWFFWDHKNHISIYGWRRVVIFVSTMIVVFFYREVIIYFSSKFGMFEDFANYANDLAANNRDFYVSLFKLVIVLMLSSRLRCRDEKNAFFINLLIVTTLVGMTGFTHPQVKRIAYYFSVPAETVLVGYIPYCFKTEQRNMGAILVVGFYIGLFTLTYYVLGQSHILPYIFDITSAW